MPETPLKITFPLLNPNEPEATLAGLYVTNRQAVQAGDLLCTLETTKSTAEVEAPRSGYVVALEHRPGDLVRAGEFLCYLASDSAWEPETGPGSAASSEPVPAADPVLSKNASAPEGLRITHPALALARQHGLDLESLPRGPIVTEAMIAALIKAPVVETTRDSRQPDPQLALDPTGIIIYGAGGHGKALAELIQSLGCYKLIGFVDDGRARNDVVLGLPVLGGGEVLPKLYARGMRLAVNAVGGIGSIQARLKVFASVAEAGFTCPAVIHPTAWIEPSASIEPGVQVMPHAYVGSEAQISYGAIINTGAIVSHDCKIGAYCNLSPGAILAGEVRIGERTLIGMGATINLQVSVGAGARIGNGATVKQDVPEGGLVRAGAIWPE